MISLRRRSTQAAIAACLIGTVGTGCGAQPPAGEHPSPRVSARAAIPRGSAEWYRTATTRQVGGVCQLTPRDSARVITFACGVVGLQLKPGTPDAAISRLLTAIAATEQRGLDRPIGGFVKVPVGTELSAIQRAYADSNVIRALLNFDIRMSLGDPVESNRP
jgi:hypothetical protein